MSYHHLKIKNKIYGGRYGLSSKNTTPNDIYDVFMSLKIALKQLHNRNNRWYNKYQFKRYDYCCLKTLKK